MGEGLRKALSRGIKSLLPPDMEHEELEPRYQIVYAMLRGRMENGMTQRDLSQATGITQPDISKLENGTANPSLHTLEKVAAGLGMTLRVEFVRPSHETRPQQAEGT